MVLVVMRHRGHTYLLEQRLRLRAIQGSHLAVLPAGQQRGTLGASHRRPSCRQTRRIGNRVSGPPQGQRRERHDASELERRTQENLEAIR